MEVSGVSTSGSSGSNAVGKSANSSKDASSPSLIVFGPSATSTANGWLSFWGRGGTTNSTITARNNWVTLDITTYSTPNSGLASGYTLLSSGASSDWTGTANDSGNAGVIIELVLDNPAIPVVITPSVQGRRFRIPQPPGGIKDPVVFQYLNLVARQLNQEAFISLFSGTDPNTSGFTGIPGNLAVNIGSASTWTRLWVQAGSVASVSTTSWHPFRVA